MRRGVLGSFKMGHGHMKNQQGIIKNQQRIQGRTLSPIPLWEDGLTIEFNHQCLIIWSFVPM